MDKQQSDIQTPPLVVHLVNRLAIGGLENGLVNLINHMPASRYRHAIICLKDFTEFRKRLWDDVPIFSIGKADGQDLHAHLRIWRILKRLGPAILHTRNLSTLEYVLSARMAGVPIRIHGEHGRDVHDDCGKNWKFQVLRRVMGQWIHQFTAVSEDLSGWLRETVKIPDSKITQIYNGVDVVRFSPRSSIREAVGPPGFSDPKHFLVGTVGRMQTVKDQVTLVRAFLDLQKRWPLESSRARLLVIGDGPLREEAQRLVQQAHLVDKVWMPGEREDIPDIMRAMDLFVLPSQAEGISNTLLEAMACGLPVVATRVGGNEELVVGGVTGTLVPPSNPSAMAEALLAYLRDESMVHQHGSAGRVRVEQRFGMDVMVAGYLAVYDRAISAYARGKRAGVNGEHRTSD